MIRVIVQRVTLFPDIYEQPLTRHVELEGTKDDLLCLAFIERAIEAAFGYPCAATVCAEDDPEWGFYHHKGRFLPLEAALEVLERAQKQRDGA